MDDLEKLGWAAVIVLGVYLALGGRRQAAPAPVPVPVPVPQLPPPVCERGPACA